MRRSRAEGCSRATARLWSVHPRGRGPFVAPRPAWWARRSVDDGRPERYPRTAATALVRQERRTGPRVRGSSAVRPGCGGADSGLHASIACVGKESSPEVGVRVRLTWGNARFAWLRGGARNEQRNDQNSGQNNDKNSEQRNEPAPACSAMHAPPGRVGFGPRRVTFRGSAGPCRDCIPECHIPDEDRGFIEL